MEVPFYIYDTNNVKKYLDFVAGCQYEASHQITKGKSSDQRSTR
jgi:hypothetical protein